MVKAKAEGRLDPNATITAEELIVVERPAAYDYNPQLAAQTGRYGNAQVWIKGQGFLGAGFAPVDGPAESANAKIARMEQELAVMKAGGGSAQPFPS